ncbi:MAG: P-II family nitrogen regulator [Chlorobium sp.]|uniref:P-II family nitrogen regulator n=1 Tax=Chlorobium sp. TaxID=1095 RepID=UPI0025BA704A|nr:P-II family nitrogen regulator [Chlorobium sp.]MCF8216044.1 P-II family nitrogen regulator [Chlorobium sp.]MCF8270945.1 P-II family nitrogen regulator [Chlorobium sp.]MCF8287319.1 P-II family nitrogen regulator [Chlorobium sp.]MCF8291405.1 P-II family nitrogen regulator [Chlorobium sp.]MCF8384953.1 P-II family nitrogen regulator [Chlorobium sp.]
MKYIVAMIQPHKLPDVKAALAEVGVRKMTVTNALGCGAQGGYTEVYRGVPSEVNLLKKIKVEIGVNDDYADKTVKAIVKGAKTGEIGDGKIFVFDLPQCIRIRTEETGNDAIG